MCLSVRARPCTCERARVFNFSQLLILFFFQKNVQAHRARKLMTASMLLRTVSRELRVFGTFDAEKNAIDDVRRYRIIIITRVVKTKLSRCGRAIHSVMRFYEFRMSRCLSEKRQQLQQLWSTHGTNTTTTYDCTPRPR